MAFVLENPLNVELPVVKVSENEACSIASAIWAEVSCLEPQKGEPSWESAHFVRDAARLHETGHGCQLVNLFAKYSLSANIPIANVDIGARGQHPVLRPRDFVTGLSSHEKLKLLFCNHDGKDYADFWAHWRLIQPEHPVFESHRRKLSSCIPIFCFGDEGTSQKKKPLMVLQWQPILGWGSSRADDVNMLGVSVTTRFLYSVLQGKEYSGKSKKNEPLHRLIDHLAKDLRTCYDKPIPIEGVSWTKQVHLICLGFKGDLQGLIKVGKLSRNFMRDTATGNGPGICHLCRAGQEGMPWHNTEYCAMKAMKKDVPPPWKEEPSLVAQLPHSPSHKAQFFCVDLFHTLLKGVFGDIAANCVVSRSGTLLCTSFPRIQHTFPNDAYSMKSTS